MGDKMYNLLDLVSIDLWNLINLITIIEVGHFIATSTMHILISRLATDLINRSSEYRTDLRSEA